MKIDLVSDYKKLMLEKIRSNPLLKIPDDMDDEKIIIKHIEYKRKLTFAGPHEIKISKNFKCPREYQNGYLKLKKIIEQGGDIVPYLNRASLEFEKYDDMFADWGILHFHLGSYIPKGDKFVKRGKYVLFAYNKDDIIYFINIYDHEHWSDKEVIQEMYNNWPEILEPFTLKGITAITPDITYKERTEMRKKGGNAVLSIKDNKGKTICLSSPGYGQTGGRNSVLEFLYYDNAQLLLRDIEKQLKEKEHILVEDMKKYGYTSCEEPFIKLIDFNTQKLKLQDQNFKEFEIPII